MFYSNVPVALFAAGVAAALFYGRATPYRVTRFDGVGFVLLALILGGTQTILNMGNDYDWLANPVLLGLAITVAVALPAFVIWELGERRPVLDMRLYLHRNTRWRCSARCSASC